MTPHKMASSTIPSEVPVSPSVNDTLGPLFVGSYFATASVFLSYLSRSWLRSFKDYMVLLVCKRSCTSLHDVQNSMLEQWHTLFWSYCGHYLIPCFYSIIESSLVCDSYSSMYTKTGTYYHWPTKLGTRYCPSMHIFGRVVQISHHWFCQHIFPVCWRRKQWCKAHINGELAL